jgi:hypothetical protein
VVRKHKHEAIERKRSAVPDQRAALAELKRSPAFREADPAVKRWITHLLGGKFGRPTDKTNGDQREKN